ncbi:MAG: MATE family efflux transporter [Anaerotignum sp.]|nr:MATE family efflux transporter [Anaerotignum sp.]MBR6542766.1 MATE family efflux transporter [Anaerotignum sp.]
MNIQLSDHFTYGRLIRFVIPSVAMMIFTSVYGVVDGLFVSNFVGKTPFAAVNLIMPFCMILGAFGFMFGTGGTALVAKTLGEGKDELANQIFSMLIYVALGLGIMMAIFGMVFVEPIAMKMGADDAMLGYCVKYARIVLFGLPFFMLQNMFQSFLIAAEKPQMGLVVTVAAGVTNMALDALFIAVLDWGVTGAAMATALSQFVGGMVPFLFFVRKNNSKLHLARTKLMWRELLRTCTNGSSELVTNISLSLVCMLYNLQLMKIAGENGVAAYGVIMYVNFIFISIYLGYAFGTAPIVSFNYGARNTEELQNVLKKSLKLLVGAGITLFLVATLSAGFLSKIFVGYDAELYAITVKGFRLYAISYLLSGINIYASSFFTALNNGLISALISFLRTVVFEVAFIMILPIFFGLSGIWCAIVVAELASFIITAVFFFKLKNKYGYL